MSSEPRQPPSGRTAHSATDEQSLTRHCAALAASGRFSELRDELATNPLFSTLDDGFYWLVDRAVRRGDARLVGLFLKIGVSPNDEAGYTGGYTPLAVAISAPEVSPAVVDALLSGGADPNQRVVQGTTPLLIAVRRNDIQVALKLLAHGADPRLGDMDDGTTPLALARRLGHAEIARVLADHGAS